MCGASFLVCKIVACVPSPRPPIFFAGGSACVEPYDNTCQALWFGSGASPPWNEVTVQLHCHSHESELLFV